MKMNVDKNQVIQYTFASGAKLGLALVAILLIFYFQDAMFGEAVFMFSMIIYAVVIYFTLKKFRDSYRGGFISYGQSVWFGARVATLSGVLVGFYYFLMIKVFDPSLATTMVAEMEEAYLAMGLSEQHVETMYQAIRLSASPWLLFFSSIFNGFVYGLVISLVIAFFIKRKGDPFQEAMRNVE